MFHTLYCMVDRCIPLRHPASHTRMVSTPQVGEFLRGIDRRNLCCNPQQRRELLSITMQSSKRTYFMYTSRPCAHAALMSYAWITDTRKACGKSGTRSGKSVCSPPPTPHILSASCRLIRRPIDKDLVWRVVSHAHGPSRRRPPIRASAAYRSGHPGATLIITPGVGSGSTSPIAECPRVVRLSSELLRERDGAGLRPRAKADLRQTAVNADIRPCSELGASAEHHPLHAPRAIIWNTIPSIELDEVVHGQRTTGELHKPRPDSERSEIEIEEPRLSISAAISAFAAASSPE